MSKRYSGKSFKDASVMKKPKLSLKEKRKIRKEKNKKKWKIYPINYRIKMAIKTKACDKSIRLHRLPLTFTLYLQLKMLIKANVYYIA